MPVLRVRKQPWSNHYRPDVVRGTPLRPPAIAAIRYFEILQSLINRMTVETEMQLRHLFKDDAAQEYFAQDASVASQARVLTNALMKKFDDLFAQHAKPIAEQMAKTADRDSKTALHASFQKLLGAISLSPAALSKPDIEILTATVAENVGLIKSIPEQYLNAVQGAVMRSITTGNGMADLMPFLQKYKSITITRAKLIATDQTKKAFTMLTIGRMRNSGMKKFEWLHSQRGHTPRPLHKNVLNHQIFDIDEPPVIQEAKGSLPEVRGFPGQLINCGCVALPVLEFGGED